MNKFITASSTPKKNRGRRQTHPNTQTMVDEAFKVLNKNKCSYRAIKHFIAARYIVDMRYVLNRIKSYIRESLANGKLIQMTGHGLNGSFRLSAAAKRNPKEFFKKAIRNRNILLRKKNKKPTTFLTEPIRRRTSLTRTATKQVRLNLKRSPRPRLAKTGISYSIDSDDENDNLPSTSSEAVYRVTRQNNSFKMSHMF